MYRVEVLDGPRAVIAALPAEVLDELAEALDLLEIAPWTGPPHNKNNPDGAVRRVLFGHKGAGQLVYVILENTCEVKVVLIVWFDG